MWLEATLLWVPEHWKDVLPAHFRSAEHCCILFPRINDKLMQKKKGGGNCAFNCPRTHACVAPACASTSCYSCANSHLSCSKYWANFITFGLCLSTQYLSNGVLVAIRERVHCCLAPRWGNEKPYAAWPGWRLSSLRVATHPPDCSKNQIFVLEDRAEAISTRNMPSLTGWKILDMHRAIILFSSWHTLPSNFVLNSPFLQSQKCNIKQIWDCIQGLPNQLKNELWSRSCI